MAFGTTQVDALGIPVASNYVPGTVSSNLTALQGGPVSTDANSQKSAPVSIFWYDGTATGTAVNDQDVVTIPVPGGQSTVLVQITGNNVGTLLFEGSPDSGTNFYAITARNVVTMALATSTTVIGLWRANVSGFTNFRVRLHPTTSGTATIRLILTLGMETGAGPALGAAGIYNTVPPPLVALQQQQLQLDINSNLQINPNTYISGEDPTIVGTNANGLMVVEQRFAKTFITTNATTAVKGSPGLVKGIAVGDPGSAWVIAVYDALSATGTPFTIKPTVGNYYPLDALFLVGVTVVTSGTTPGSLSVAWR